MKLQEEKAGAHPAELGADEPTLQGYTLNKAMGLYNLVSINTQWLAKQMSILVPLGGAAPDQLLSSVPPLPILEVPFPCRNHSSCSTSLQKTRECYFAGIGTQ